MTPGFKIPSLPAIHSDTALELMVHHLQLAHTFYQLIPDDSRDEVQRILTEQYKSHRWKDDGGFGQRVLDNYYPDAPEAVAGMVWFDKMEEMYEEMKKDD